jgi:PIN domain nuclease of toxin-antitoxin system
VRLLLDTHVLLWLMEGDESLAPRVRDLISNPTNDVLISVASLWEISVKVRVGKLKADIAKIARLTEERGGTILAISLEHLLQLAQLPLHHRDPFDHLLIAQAIAEGATFVTADRHAARYPVPRLAAD